MDEEDTSLDTPEGADEEGQEPDALIAPEVDLADEEGFPTSDPVAAPPHTLMRRVIHAPSQRYWYDGSAETFHPVLGFIKPGENRFTSTDADTVSAVEACVEAGVLRVR